MKGQAPAAIATALMVAMLLIIGLVVFGNFHTVARTQSNFEIVIVNETLNSTNAPLATYLPRDFTTDFSPVKDDSVSVLVQNGTNVYVLPAANITETNNENGTVTVGVLGSYNTTGLRVTASYTYYGGDAFDNIETTANQAYSGFGLGSILPLVLFAVAIIGIILTAFAFGRR